MCSRNLAVLATTASTFAIMAAHPALAQSSDQTTASTGAGLEEIVVTARRREEKAQAVPITISTLSQSAMEQQGIRSANDLNKDIPSIQLTGANQGTVSYAWIRGVPGVLGYFDQVPTVTTKSIGLNGNAFFFDMDNVQVLKGPQGTLFGLSTNGGAVLYESKKPMNGYDGYLQLGAGNYGHFEAEGVINVPIIPDKLLLRAGGQYEMTDGYLHDVLHNRDFDSQLYGVGRVSIVFRPIDEIENDVVINYYHSHNSGTAYVWTLLNPNGIAGKIFGNSPFIGLNGKVQFGLLNAFNQQLQLGKYAMLGSNVNGSSFQNQSQLNVVDTASLNLNDSLTVKNIFGYQEVLTSSHTDTDGTPFPILDGQTQLANGRSLPITERTPDVSYTEELQLQGQAFDDRLSFTIGSFNQWRALRSPSYPGYSDILGTISGVLTYQSSRTNGLYAQGTYNLSDYIDGLSFTAGYRYTWDKEEFRQDSYRGAMQTLVNSVGYVGNFHPSAPGSYTLSLDYQASPNTMFYVTDSVGFSTGGFNNNAPPGFQEFQPETLDNVEIGVKSDWDVAGIKARTNLSAYYGFYSNIQTVVTAQVPNPSNPGGPPVLQVLTENSATAHIEGIESSITIVPDSAFEFMANVGYNVAKYDQYTSLSSSGHIQDLSGTPFVQDPKWMISLFGTYHLPVNPAFGNITFNAIWSAQSTEINTSQLPVIPAYITPGFDQLDMNLVWKDLFGYEGTTLTLWGTNVLGNPVTNGPFGVYSALGVAGYAPKPPPMFGFRVRYDFGGPTS